MKIREKTLELVADMEQTDNELTDKLLSLYRVTNRKFFVLGLVVGLVAGVLGMVFITLLINGW